MKKVKLFGKSIGEFSDVFFSSDLHINHERVITFGRNFENVEVMNDYVIDEINRLCDADSLLVLLGDTLMIDKNYNSFISKLQCNLIMLYGNHCNRNRFNEVTGECSNRLLYHGDYCELAVDKQIFCCSHYPMMHWNYQDEGSISLHGHTHAFESDILYQIHKYKSLDVGIDSFYQKYGVYSIFSYSNIVAYLNSNKTADRH